MLAMNEMIRTKYACNHDTSIDLICLQSRIRNGQIILAIFSIVTQYACNVENRLVIT